VGGAVIPAPLPIRSFSGERRGAICALPRPQLPARLARLGADTPAAQSLLLEGMPQSLNSFGRLLCAQARTRFAGLPLRAR
jgi:hypothetical protein